MKARKQEFCLQHRCMQNIVFILLSFCLPKYKVLTGPGRDIFPTMIGSSHHKNPGAIHMLGKNQRSQPSLTWNLVIVTVTRIVPGANAEPMKSGPL